MIELKYRAVINIFAMPMEACDLRKTWKAAFDHLANRLYARYGSRIDMKFIEIFSPESFTYPEILTLLENNKKPPFITVNGKVIDSGGKLSERIIRGALENPVITPDSEIDHRE